MSLFQFNFKTMNSYEIHKAIVNTYVLKKPGDTALLTRDTSRDKRDVDVIKENHRFLWNEEPDTWEERLAKKYCDKLFKEYCICDLTLYKENKVALRWRTEQEVVVGKGQFSCGNKKCNEKEDLRTWEVNFGYYENNEKKNALVKLRLCPPCSNKLNYRVKKREVKRLSRTKNKKNKQRKNEEQKEPIAKKCEELDPSTTSTNLVEKEETLWAQPQETVEKTREEEFEEYLEDLLF